ncbi:flagellar hook-associated protein FlgK [Aquabacterium sp.]|uniref:flagellar hook-associated protein FlgK n=1 Tax=Aquabacterium sp. TaxID=1872578 RepID=UPI0024887F6C|nr:flagellar hook-associated protein FlgK [Aquabacterium sp.]MDI1260654.1 flagellar hook-associated protein FlgK [Aquabacterium sp.]
MGSGLLTLGTRAMFANQAKLDTIAHNISNASTEGYSRQEVQLSTEGGRYTGAGFYGRGVKIDTVTRASDSLLARDYNNNLSIASADQMRLDKLTQLEKALATGASGIGYAAGQMLNSFVDVANQPQDLSARQVVLSKAAELASRMSTAGTQLNDLQGGTLSDMKATVAEINSLAARIADMNQKIASVTGVGHEPNDLIDQRDLLVKNLSEKIQVSTVPADDGSISVFIGGGQQLVLSNQASTLGVQADQYDATQGRITIGTGNNQRTLDESLLTGGSLAGLLKVQNEDIPAARNLLGQMASALSWRVNQQQSFGLDLGTPASAGAAIFSVGTPQVLPSNKNTSSTAFPPVTMTVIDARELQASDYSLVEDPATPGSYRLTRLSDNTFTSVADGDVVDGFRINIDAATIASGDKFMLRPVGNAALSMKRVLDKPTGIAAASPVNGTLGTANTGTATVASLSIVATPSTPYDAVTVAFTGASGTGQDYEIRDSGGGVLVSGTWQPGSPIEYNGFELNLNGVPKDGDTITVAPTLYPSSNNGNALSLLALRDEDIVGRINQGAGGTAPGATITNAYSQVIGSIGVRVQDAMTSATISATLAANSQELLTNKTGVNLDEEAARLIQFQQGYQAAAKILQVAQSVFDTLLSISR